MKIRVSTLRKLIREELSHVHEAPLPFVGKSGIRGNGLTTASVPDLVKYARKQFAQIGHDLGVDDLADPTFLDWLGDHLTDMGVPYETTEEVEMALTGGPVGENSIGGGAVTFGGQGSNLEKNESSTRDGKLAESSGLNPHEEEEFDELVNTPEYMTLETFVDFKMSDMESPDDVPSFSHIDAAALAFNLEASIVDIIKTLKDYGMTMKPREPAKRVRGFTTSSNDRWYGPGSQATHGGAGIDSSSGRATVRGKTI